MDVKIVGIPTKDSLYLPGGFVPFEARHRVATLYHLEGNLEFWHYSAISNALLNPLLHLPFFVNKSGECAGDLDVIRNSPHIIEVRYAPGVTDNLANVVQEIAYALFELGEIDVKTSKVYIFHDLLTPDELDAVLKSIHNPVVHSASVYSGEQYADAIMPHLWPTHKKREHVPQCIRVNLNVDDYELGEISRFGIQDGQKKSRRGALGLSIGDIKEVARYSAKRNLDISDIELECIAQTWSEHCKHRIFNSPVDDIPEGMFNRFIKRATEEIMKQKPNFCVSVFSDNSGAISLDDQYLITHKVETHNSPSALEPFGGAMTGVLGVNRDCLGFGMASQPIANTYGFCFAEPDEKKIYREKGCKNPILDARKIINDVILGVEVGGNCSGIPTPHGLVYYDKSYRGKPLVYVGTVGIIPRVINNKPSHITEAKNGDLIVMIGGGVGRDGIHGATLSSDTHDERGDISMVQIGNPYLQKKLTDAIFELRNKGLYNAITDNGAGGLSSSVCEMGKKGFSVDLEMAHVKTQFMDPWEMWISESQERMTLAVPPNKINKLIEVLHEHGVQGSVIGTFNNSGAGVVKYNGDIVMNLEMNFLHNGYHKEYLISEIPEQPTYLNAIESDNLALDILQLLRSPNICSREKIVRRYDHEVQGTSVMKPMISEVCSDTAVIRAILEKNIGVAITSSMLPGYSNPVFGQDTHFDTYNMAGCTIDTAIRNLVAAGADPDKIALLDNFCWRDSKNPRSFWQLKRAAEACYDYAKVFGAPFISGKDSMFNDFVGYDSDDTIVKISATPTLLISAVAIIENINKIISLDFKNPGDIIYITGHTHSELGGSEYYKIKGVINTSVPKSNAHDSLQVYKKIFTASQLGLIASAISLHIGGLAVGLAKSAMAGLLGCTINLDDIPSSDPSPTTKLFSESQGRILLSVRPEQEGKLLEVMQDTAIKAIGVVGQGDVVLSQKGNNVCMTIEEILNAYKTNSLYVV